MYKCLVMSISSSRFLFTVKKIQFNQHLICKYPFYVQVFFILACTRVVQSISIHLSSCSFGFFFPMIWSRLSFHLWILIESLCNCLFDGANLEKKSNYVAIDRNSGRIKHLIVYQNKN